MTDTLKIDHAVTEELQRLETDGKNELQATVDTNGIEAEVSHEVKGWSVSAYAKKLWKGPWIGGGKVKKSF